VIQNTIGMSRGIGARCTTQMIGTMAVGGLDSHERLTVLGAIGSLKMVLIPSISLKKLTPLHCAKAAWWSFESGGTNCCWYLIGHGAANQRQDRKVSEQPPNLDPAPLGQQLNGTWRKRLLYTTSRSGGSGEICATVSAVSQHHETQKEDTRWIGY
jgi:hypothetical protein